MNNKTLDESDLFELYVLAAMKLMSIPLEEGQTRVIHMEDVWKEAMSFFPEELPQEDMDAFIARPPEYSLLVVRHAGERLTAED
jgi:hypothetical protein